MSINLSIMKSNFSYDLLIIGGGISACVFASKYIQNNTTIISLYYNDIEGLNALPFATEKCNSLNVSNAASVAMYELSKT